MERKRPSFELIALAAVLVLGAVLARWWSERKGPTPAAVHFAMTSQRTAGDFDLDDLQGRTLRYHADGHPQFIILTAIGCGDCRARVPLDKEAIAAAHASEVTVWNILVYANQVNGKQFVDEFHPSEDLIVVDPSGAVAVRQLGGSDATCWIMLDGQGKICWQGPGTRDNIDRALKSVGLSSTPSSSLGQ